MTQDATPPRYAAALAAAVAAAREAGAMLRSELHRVGGARCQAGDPSHAPIDTVAEQAIRARLLGAFPYGWLGEETGESAGTDLEHVWLVDPNDGTVAYVHGSRLSAVSIGLVRSGVPVLGVVYAMASPDDDGDLFAWAEGCGPLTRNDVPVTNNLRDATLSPGAVVLVSHYADQSPAANARYVAPGRYRALPSPAHRLALAAAGEGVAGVSLGHPHAWDVAAGHALVRAVGGVLLSEDGQELTYDARGAMRSTQACVGGAPAVAHELIARAWRDVLIRPTDDPGTKVLVRPVAGMLVRDPPVLARAQGCLLGQLIGDALGGLVEFMPAHAIAARYPDGVRELVDGGTWNTLAGQPTDDSEMALALARSIVAEEGYQQRAAASAYVAWMDSGPFDMGGTTRQALAAGRRGGSPMERVATMISAASRDSQANGSLMRCSVLGILCAGRAADAAGLARIDSVLTHPHGVCQVSCAAYVSAIAAAIAGASAREAYEQALSVARASDGSPEVEASLLAAAQEAPEDFHSQQGWVRIALQNAFYQLLHAPDVEAALVDTIGHGGDTDTNAAIAGALVGAVHGREGHSPPMAQCTAGVPALEGVRRAQTTSAHVLAR